MGRWFIKYYWIVHWWSGICPSRLLYWTYIHVYIQYVVQVCCILSGLHISTYYSIAFHGLVIILHKLQCFIFLKSEKSSYICKCFWNTFLPPCVFFLLSQNLSFFHWARQLESVSLETYQGSKEHHLSLAFSKSRKLWNEFLRDKKGPMIKLLGFWSKVYVECTRRVNTSVNSLW